MRLFIDLNHRGGKRGCAPGRVRNLSIRKQTKEIYRWALRGVQSETSILVSWGLDPFPAALITWALSIWCLSKYVFVCRVPRALISWYELATVNSSSPREKCYRDPSAYIPFTNDQTGCKPHYDVSLSVSLERQEF